MLAHCQRQDYLNSQFTLNPRGQTNKGSKTHIKWFKLWITSEEPYVHPTVKNRIGLGVKHWDRLEDFLCQSDFVRNKHLRGIIILYAPNNLLYMHSIYQIYKIYEIYTYILYVLNYPIYSMSENFATIFS